MTTRTTRTLSLVSAGILVLVAAAGPASALDQNIVSVSIPQTADSCTVTEDSPECEYDCLPGQLLSVSANRGSHSEVSISTSCGGQSANCSSSSKSDCSDTSGPVPAPGTGVCTLADGANGSCASSHLTVQI